MKFLPILDPLIYQIYFRLFYIQNEANSLNQLFDCKNIKTKPLIIYQILHIFFHEKNNIYHISICLQNQNLQKFEIHKIKRSNKIQIVQLMANKQKIANDINKLIVSINKNADEKFKQQMRNHASNILSSFIGRKDDNNDPNYWKNMILSRVQKNYDTRSVLQCQQTCNRVLASSTIVKKAQVLKMLFNLSKTTEKMGENLDEIFNPSSMKNPKENLSQTNVTHLNNTRTYEHPSRSLQKTNKIPKQLEQIRFRGSLNSGISQQQILKEITFQLQNIKSQLIIKDSEGNSALRPTIEISDTVRRIVRQLSEIGWLYGKIMEEDGQHGGAVKKALNLAVREQMSEYYRWLAIIENMIKNEELTLRKLVLWSYQPFQRIKWLAIVLQAAKPFEGCQIISIINSYRPQGSNSINQLLNRLLNRLLQPLFQYIYNWVYRGQLTDPYGQFFIKHSKLKSSNIPQWVEWRQKFEIDQSKIPNVLDYESALHIFNAGKTLYFLKNRCQTDFHLNIEFFDSKTALTGKISESTTILSPEFKSWLKNLSNVLNKELVKVMYDKFLLKQHMNALKMFYLIGKGDFIQNLMDSLRSLLNQPKHLVNQYELDRTIGKALDESFSHLKSKDKELFKSQITDRLLAKKVENGGDGWDVFNFNYVVEDPVNTVISPNAIHSYQKIFNFLWKIKRVQQNLKDIWINSIKQFHGSTLPVLHQCNLLRQEMSHFINNLYGYLMISIESAWNNFCQKIQKIDSLDTILESHEKLLEQLIEITLSNQKSKHSCASLGTVFNAIIKFTYLQEQLTEKFTDYYQKRRTYLNRKGLIQQGLDFEEQLEPPFLNIQKLDEQILEIKETYQKSFDRFYSTIKKEAMNGDIRINTLCFRLDFSGFYSKIEYTF